MLDTINKCELCGEGLTLVKECGHWDIMNEVDVIRDVKVCNKCNTTHYIEDGCLAYEYTFIPFGERNQEAISGWAKASDQAIALEEISNN